MKQKEIELTLHDSRFELPHKDCKLMLIKKPNFTDLDNHEPRITVVDYKKGNPVGADYWAYVSELFEEIDEWHKSESYQKD